MGRAAGLWLAVLVSSCAPTQFVTWDRLADDETVWARCQRLVAEHHCGRLTPATDMPGRAACVLGFMNDFHAQTTYQTQRAWLLDNGCPATLVSPEQVLLLSDDFAPRPRRCTRRHRATAWRRRRPTAGPRRASARPASRPA